ncbi:hypothetical protein [Murdochiella vaginalis]|uniref:hypothetical protein n=1 Tax=Murdochiella vaginalis TaxID=1852373 RepID=UPI0008FE0EFD|nr:hypothetical protein [Murdochiella vaginalis]
MNGMNQGDFLLDLFENLWDTYAVKKERNISSKATRPPSTKSHSVQEGERVVAPVISMEGEGVVPPVRTMEGESVVPPVISMEGEGVVPPVISMEGEGVVPSVISMEGPPEDKTPADTEQKQQKPASKQTEKATDSTPLSELARELSAPNRMKQKAWLTQAVVAKELLSTPAERRKARHERMLRRLRRQRGE